RTPRPGAAIEANPVRNRAAMAAASPVPCYIAARSWQDRAPRPGSLPHRSPGGEGAAGILPSIGFTGLDGISRTLDAPGGAADGAKGDGGRRGVWDGSTATFFAPALGRSC